MNNPITICGLECDKCSIYLIDEDEAIAEQMLGWFKEEGWRPKTTTVQEFMQEGKFCKGCRSDRQDKHWSANCEFLICCVDEKKLDSCHKCSEFVCEKLVEWSKKSEKYAEGIERLKGLKQKV
ncbi:MAG: DUF3795 domain-containing protein [Asgard group archaeon]|nr:DUF3795 domain-containing protein [Asgard group archaeon]